ncbi:MAG: condensation domain-containing protein, partial [Gemmatimonadota bacterium]
MESIVGYRLSPRQRHLWALLQDGGPGEARALLRLRGALDPAALASALEALVARHEVLRTSFERLPGMPEALQVVEDRGVALEAGEELAALPAEARQARLEAAWAGGEGSPLPAGRLLRTGEAEHLLLLRVHALGADEASFEHLARDLAALYAAERGGGAVEDEPVPYLAVSEWLNEVASAEEAQAGRAHWARQCEGEEAPLAVERDDEPAAGSAAARRALPAALAASLEAFAERAGIPADAVLLAGWMALLHRMGRAGSVRVGVAFDGRADDELRHAVGPFTEHLPVAAPVDA